MTPARDDGGESRLRSRARSVFGSLWVQALLIAGLFEQIWRAYFGHAALPKSAYESTSLLASALREPAVLALVLGPCVVLAPFWRRIAWPALDPRRRIRLAVLVPAALLTWAVATFGHNHYFDQPYLADRLVLVVLCALVWLHPLFVAPLTFALLAFSSQTLHPLPGSSWIWVDRRLPFDILVLFLAYLAVKALCAPRRPWLFPFMALCLAGGTYWHAALAKMSAGPTPWTWLLDNHTSNLLVSSHLAIGFAGFLELDTVLALARMVRPFDGVLNLVTLVIEASGLLLVVSRRLTHGVLLALVLLHCGIVFLSGIFFWKWILVDLALVWLVGRLHRDGALRDLDPESTADADDPESSDAPTPHESLRARILRFAQPRGLYRPATTLAAVLLMLSLQSWSLVVPFAWFDSRVVNHFVIYGIDDERQRHRLDGRLFAPYDILLQQSRYFYTTGRPLLADTFGTCYDFDLTRALDSASADDLPALRATSARVWRQPYLTRRFGNFLEQSVRSMQGRDGALYGWWASLAPPFHFRSTAGPGAWNGTPRLAAVEVVLEELFCDGARVVPVHRRQVLFVPLED
ncbi:MAG: hypothetical protein AAGC60_06325 [Acidobacteriota bacterium]